VSSSDYGRQLKPIFDGRMEEYELKFGALTDNDPSLKIHNGRITLSNQDLKPVFDAVVDKIITSCSRIMDNQKPEVP
jgi:hypothetical protein